METPIQALRNKMPPPAGKKLSSTRGGHNSEKRAYWGGNSEDRASNSPSHTPGRLKLLYIKSWLDHHNTISIQLRNPPPKERYKRVENRCWNQNLSHLVVEGFDVQLSELQPSFAIRRELGQVAVQRLHRPRNILLCNQNSNLFKAHERPQRQATQKKKNRFTTEEVIKTLIRSRYFLSYADGFALNVNLS